MADVRAHLDAVSTAVSEAIEALDRLERRLTMLTETLRIIEEMPAQMGQSDWRHREIARAARLTSELFWEDSEEKSA